jgi:hypothetical protein
MTKHRADGREPVLDRRTDFVVLPDVIVLCSDLLAAWRAVKLALDPDVETGYSIYDYDYSFLDFLSLWTLACTAGQSHACKGHTLTRGGE